MVLALTVAVSATAQLVTVMPRTWRTRPRNTWSGWVKFYHPLREANRPVGMIGALDVSGRRPSG